MVNFAPKGEANQSRQYLWGVVLVLAVSYFSHQAKHFISEDNLMLFFLVQVIGAALYWGEGPATLVAFLSFLALDFGVFQPRFRFNTPDLQYGLSLITFLGRLRHLPTFQQSAPSGQRGAPTSRVVLLAGNVRARPHSDPQRRRCGAGL